jgi:hypothetical protein
MDAGWNATYDPNATLAFDGPGRVTSARLAIGNAESGITLDTLQQRVMNERAKRGVLAKLISQSDSEADSLQWRTLEIFEQFEAGPVRETLRFGFDPNHTYFESVAVSATVLRLAPWRAGFIPRALEGFHPPPMSRAQREALEYTFDTSISSPATIPHKGANIGYAYALKPGFVESPSRISADEQPHYDGVFAFRDSDALILRIGAAHAAYTRGQAAQFMREALRVTNAGEIADEPGVSSGRLRWTVVTDPNSAAELHRTATAAYCFDSDSDCGFIIVATYPQTNDVGPPRRLMELAIESVAPPNPNALVVHTLSGGDCSISVPAAWAESLSFTPNTLLTVVAPDQRSRITIERVSIQDNYEAVVQRKALADIRNTGFRITSNNQRPVSAAGQEILERVLRASRGRQRMLAAHRVIPSGGFIYHVYGILQPGRDEPDLVKLSTLLDTFSLSSRNSASK